MKILIVSTCPTHPTTAGNRQFILSQIELFKSMGHDPYLLFVNDKYSSSKDEQPIIEQRMKEYWGSHLFFFKQSLLHNLMLTCIRQFRKIFFSGYNKCDDRYPSGLHRVINSLDEKYHFDACVVNYFFLTKAFPYIKIQKKGLVTHDYFSYKGMLVGDKYVINNLTASEEAKAMQRCPHIFALNDGEAEFFKRLSPRSMVYSIFGNFTYRPTPIVGNHALLFLSGSNPYNQNGLKWFLDEIFESITSRYPDTELYVGGAICKVLQGRQLNENIKLVGFVDDIDKFYNLGDVVINPTYQGTGLKIKTFEAIAYDKVLLTHPHSMTGIYEKNNAPIFASASAEDWVSFLDTVWGNVNTIVKIKEHNKKYLCAMNGFIAKEYQRFFDSNL